MQTLGMNMPATPSSVLAWSALALAKGMTADELAGITTAELCYVAVSYDDGVGMKVTSQVTNPACGY